MPGFRRQAQIGEPQVVDHLSLLPEHGEVTLRHVARVHEDEPQEQQANPDKEHESVRFSQNLIPMSAGCPSGAPLFRSDAAAPASPGLIQGLEDFRGYVLKLQNCLAFVVDLEFLGGSFVLKRDQLFAHGAVHVAADDIPGLMALN